MVELTERESATQRLGSALRRLAEDLAAARRANGALRRENDELHERLARFEDPSSTDRSQADAG